MSDWKEYRRKGLSQMRPYVPGEDLGSVSVGNGITPSDGGMVARDPLNHEDTWYIEADYFARHFEVAG